MNYQFSQEFIDFWRDTVEPLAKICAKDFQAIKAMEDRGHATPDEEVIIEKYQDPESIWWIGLLIVDVNKAIHDGVSFDLINSISTVAGTLEEGSTYWTTVWLNMSSTLEEGRNLYKLGKVMQKLKSLL